MDAVAQRAHRGMTVKCTKSTRTPCEDPLTDEAALLSELLQFFYIICAAWLMFQYFSDEMFSSLETPMIHLDG